MPAQFPAGSIGPLKHRLPRMPDAIYENGAAGVEVDPSPSSGLRGFNGWSMVTSLVADGERRVRRVVDWTGGQGTKPDIGLYVGPLGLVSDVAEATDDRGPKGEQGDDGPAGPDGKSAYQIAVDNGFVGTEAEWLDAYVNETAEAATQVALEARDEAQDWAISLDDVTPGNPSAKTSAAAAALDAAAAQAAAGGVIYATEAAGRAAVADGAPFLVEGTVPEAWVELHRRIDAATVTTSLRSYPSLAAVAALRTVYRLGTGVEVYRATYVVTNNAPAATFEAGGIVSVPAVNGTLIFDIFITPSLRALLSANRMDIAVVSAGGTRIDGANWRQFNGVTGLGAGVTNLVASGNDFIAANVAVEATMTKVRVTIDNNPGVGTAKIYYPEVRLVRTADVPSASTLDHKALAFAETTALSTLPVNIAANGPYSMRKLAGAGAAPSYNSATGEITIPADCQAEIVFINGANIRKDDLIVANMKVVTDDTLAGTSGVFAIPVRQTAHSIGPGVIAELNRTADNLYWQAVFLANDGDGNAPGSVVLRPDTRASGLKVAKGMVISDVWIAPGTARPPQEGLGAALTALRDAVTPVATTIDRTEAANTQKACAKASAEGRRVAGTWIALYGSDAAAGTEEAPKLTIDPVLNLLNPSATVTITIASPAVMTWNGHSLVENDVVVFTTAGVDAALPTGLVAGQKYYVTELNLTANTFSVSAVRDGPPVITSGSQSGTHTATLSGYGHTVALQGGVNHKVLAYRTVNEVNMVGIGSEPATIDARQHLTGAWTLVTGASYTKDVTFREMTQNAGVASATWNYQVWDGETLLTWIVGGADIAANKAVVDATPGSFTIYRTGSAVQDPRSDTNATGYTIYIHRADGSNPTGADISTADIAIAIQFIGGVIDNVRIIGGAWKDFAKSSSVGAIPVLKNFRTKDFGQHAWVSAVMLGGYKCQFDGVPMPGMSGDTVGRASGEGVNLYTGTFRNIDLVMDAEIIEVNNSGYGIGGHGSGNQCYRSVQIPGLLRLRNCTNGVSLGQASVTLPFAVDGIRLGEVDFQGGMDEAFSPGSSLEITRGGIVVLSNRSLNNSGARTGLYKFATSGEVFEVTDLDVYSDDERPVVLGGVSKYLFWRGFTGSTAPAFRARGLQDKSPAGRHLTAFGSTSSAFLVHIDLGPSANRPTIIGDLVPSYTATGFLPASITIAAGTTFGFAGMTRSQMRAFFDTNSVPHNISDDTTIVGLMGEVVELPA
ncbi:hypothetical protein [Mesorhizobium sp.]|uniref:hypothetical protein n=1 Tax=Mesorhizobium sp. TaxID=1871066 RepID=UPI0011F46562|nr:hypothetical protein [Mesorhizobium sp.]TIS37499.1 MAG: hypothetical protein E5W95_17960 [Mesorhizobium sp.]